MSSEGGPDPSLSPVHQHQHHLLHWLEDSTLFLSSFLDDTYAGDTANGITSYEWWSQEGNQANVNPNASPAATPLPSTLTATISSPLLPQAELSRKRKLSKNPTTPYRSVARQSRQTIADEARNKGDLVFEEEGEVSKRPLLTGRKGHGKGNAGSGNGVSKEARWAEQLLNPCAAAIEAANVSRVQRLLCVLQELQSFSGDANHRLAAHGLRALTNHLSSVGNSIPDRGRSTDASPTFATTEPKLFRSAIIKFHEVSPWFAFPNSLANASILQTLTLEPNRRVRSLHVVDIGASHGVQWPTLLDALARRQGGAPPLVRLSPVGSAPQGPFSAAPSAYDFHSHLLRYAKSINLNLQINHADEINARSLALADGEILMVCVQFRAANGGCDDRTSFIRSIRALSPDLLILSEIEENDNGEVGFPSIFARRAELLWRFLDSTSTAFKGRDCTERRVMEGEAARLMEAREDAVVEGRERWRERMMAVGFREEAFGEEATEVARGLLRKYDVNWEMRMAQREMAVTLSWKKQPVSFCSVWKPYQSSKATSCASILTGVCLRGSPNILELRPSKMRQIM